MTMPTFRTARLWIVLACGLGCSKTASSSAVPHADAPDADAGSESSDAAPNVACAAAGPVVVSLTTEDGVALEGDLYTVGAAGGPAAVLLHMVPPSNDRTNYPRALVDKLVDKGITVLNLDRRGAGHSAGVATQAYKGPNGKLDAKAAITFLSKHACAVDPARVAIIGASNGTTTALDFTVATDASMKQPRALVFLTGGTYTENQSSIADHRTRLEALPILFVFSKEERAWSANLQPAAPSTWVFKEYDPGDHGTRMFDVQPEALDVVADFTEAALRN